MHAQFMNLYAEITVRTCKSINKSEFAGSSPHVNPLICPQSLADNFTDDTTKGTKCKPDILLVGKLGKTEKLFSWLADLNKRYF